MIEVNKGWHTDNSELNQPLGTWRDAENLVIDDDKQVPRTEYGREEVGENFPSSAVVGHVTHKDFTYYFFANGSVGKQNKDNNYYQEITTGFSFSTRYPIKAKVITNAKEEIILIWTDEFNELKFLNASNPQTIDTINTNLMGLFTRTEPNDITVSVVDGGSMPNGVYVPIYRLITDQGQSTNWTVDEDYVELHTKGSTASFVGSTPGGNSGKSIKIEFGSNDLDTRFKFYEIGFIATIAEVTTVRVLGRYSTTTSSIDNVYTDLDNAITIDISEVIVPKANYPIVKDIEIVEDQLLIGGLQGVEPINYQKYANDISVDYTHSLVSAKQTESGTNQERGFMPGEVYALYIVFLMNDGSFSKAFHIPGRGLLAAEVASSSIVSGSLVYQTEDTADNGISTSNMGGWKNIDELYPETDDYLGYNVANDLRGTQVRHHRFPSIDHLYREHYSGSSTFGKSELPLLGISLSNVVIPNSIAARTKGFYVASAKRELKDSIILGYSDFQCAGETTATTNAVLKKTSGYGPLVGNIKLGAAGDVTEEITISDEAIKFSNFDLLYNKPEINPSYIWNEYRVSVDLSTSYGYNIDDNRRYLEISWGSATVTPTGSSDKAALVDSAKYIPASTVTGDINNYMGDEHILIKSGDFKGGSGAMVDNSGNEDAWINDTVSGTEVDHNTPSSSRPHKTYLTSLRQIIDNVYSPFDEQLNLELLGYKDTASAGGATYSLTIANGDIVNDYYFYMNTAPLADSTTGIIEGGDYIATAEGNNYKGRGTLARKTVIMPTVSRLSARYEDVSQDNSLLYPNTPSIAEASSNTNTGIFTVYDPTAECLRYYDKTYSTRNEFTGILPYSTFDNETFRFKNRIHRSTDFNRLSTGFDISFPANNFYELQFTKGDFIGMVEFNNRLIIRHENTAFISVPRQKVALSGGEATIGDNDIFDLEPQELISTDNGFVGGSSKFNAIKTEYGIVLIDDLNGRIFLYSSSLEEISKLGMQNYFRNNLKSNYKHTKVTYNNISSEVVNSKQVLLFTTATFDINEFNIGDIVYSDVDDTTGIVTDVRTELTGTTEYIKLSTDIVSATTLHTVITLFKKIDNPYESGIISGYDPELQRLMITKKSSSDSRKDIKYKGFYKSGMTLSTNDVVLRDQLYTWNGSSFDVTAGDTEDEFTVSFFPDPRYKFWMGKHTYTVDRYVDFKDKQQHIIASSPIQLFDINIKSETDQIPKIEIIHNVNKNIVKMYGMLMFKTLAYNLSDVLQQSETFDKLTMQNTYQDSGEIDLTNYVDVNTPNNIRAYNGVWKFNLIRDSSGNVLGDNYIKLIFRDTGVNLLYLYGFDLTFNPVRNI